jgi:hypothetical protein
VGLGTFVLRAAGVIGSTLWFVVSGACLVVLFVGDVWSVRKAARRSGD